MMTMASRMMANMFENVYKQGCACVRSLIILLNSATSPLTLPVFDVCNHGHDDGDDDHDNEIYFV